MIIRTRYLDPQHAVERTVALLLALIHLIGRLRLTATLAPAVGPKANWPTRCRCGHTVDNHRLDGPCMMCGCPDYSPVLAIDAAPTMLDPPVVLDVVEPVPTEEEQFALDCRETVAMAERFAAGQVEEEWPPHLMALAQEAVARREKNLGTPTAQPLPADVPPWGWDGLAKDNPTVHEGEPKKGMGKLPVMPGAEQVRAKPNCNVPACSLCGPDSPPHHTNAAGLLYVKDGKRYRIILPGDTGPYFRRDHRRRYYEVTP